MTNRNDRDGIDDVSNPRNIVIHIDPERSGPVNLLLRIDRRGHTIPVIPQNNNSSQHNRRHSDDRGHIISAIPQNNNRSPHSRRHSENIIDNASAHARRQSGYNFYKSHSNLDNLTGSNDLDMGKMKEWMEWRRNANLQMANTLTTDDNSRTVTSWDLSFHLLRNETISNVYKTTSSSDTSTSVLGVKSFTMFGIPRVQPTSQYYEGKGLHIDDLR